MKKILSLGIIFSFFITFPLSTSAQSVSSALCTEQNIFATPETGDFSLDTNEVNQARLAMDWIYTMMEPLGAVSNGGEIYLDQVYDFDDTGPISGSITLENPTNYPVVNPSHLIVTNPLAPENNYRGVVTGTAREVITNNTHEVRAYLFTDTEYEQPGVIPGTVASNGSWSLDLSAIPIGFAGSWRFRLYEIATNTEIGESWPREDILDGLEISLFSVTDAEYFIAKDRALPSQLFSFGTTTAGTKRVKLIDTRGTLTTGDDVVLDSYTGGTGLVRSYELSVGNEGFGTPFQERNYVYDQALALSSAISIGDIDRASDLATGLVKSQQSGGDYDGAFFFSVPQLSPTSGETIFRTGAHSIALYSLLHYIEANPGDSKISIYYESAQRALSYLDGLRVDMGPQEGLYLGGSGRYISDVYEDYSIPWASTEHNLDTWHAFKKAQKVLNDDLYESKAISLQNTILSKLWNPVAERFYQGYGPTGPDTADALDTSSWGSMMLIGIGDIAKSQTSLARLSVYEYTDGETGITGWGPYAEVGGYAGAAPTVWYEGSFGVLMAYARNNLAALYQSTLDDLKQGQLASGAFRYATDRDATYEIITAPSIASTAWYILATVGRDDFWQECSYIDPIFSNSNGSSGGSRRRSVCADPKALNFDDTKFARSDSSLCKYAIESSNEEIVGTISPSVTLDNNSVSGLPPLDTSKAIVPENVIEIESINIENSIYESTRNLVPVDTRRIYFKEDFISEPFDYKKSEPIVIEEFPTIWEKIVQFLKKITNSVIKLF